MKNKQKYESIQKRIDAFKIDKSEVKKGKFSENTPFNIAIELIAGIISGLIIGLFLDNLFDSKPIMLIICIILAFIAAFKSIWKKHAKVEK